METFEGRGLEAARNAEYKSPELLTYAMENPEASKDIFQKLLKAVENK